MVIKEAFQGTKEMEMISKKGITTMTVKETPQVAEETHREAIQMETVRTQRVTIKVQEIGTMGDKMARGMVTKEIGQVTVGTKMLSLETTQATEETPLVTTQEISRAVAPKGEMITKGIEVKAIMEMEISIPEMMTETIDPGTELLSQGIPQIEIKSREIILVKMEMKEN